MTYAIKLSVIFVLVLTFSGCTNLIKKIETTEEENSMSGAGSLLTTDKKSANYELLDIETLKKEYGLDTMATNVTYAVNQSKQSEGRYRRNELQDRIISASNQKCAAFIRTLVSSKSSTQLAWGGFSTLLSGAAAVTTPASASKVLAAGSTVSSGVLSAYNEAYFNNLALNVISTGIVRQRQAQLAELLSHRGKNLPEYSVNQAISDALTYHAACSIVSGLETASAATKTAPTETFLGKEKVETETSTQNSQDQKTENQTNANAGGR